MTRPIDESAETATSAIEAYAVGTIWSVRRIPIGLIHRTFLIDTSSGKFVLQRLHPDLSSDAILSDYEAVTAHLAEQHFPAPRLVNTMDGRKSVDTKDGRYRLITHVNGESHEAVRDERMVFEAAKMIGVFHVAMNEFRYAFQSGRSLHDSPKHWMWMREAAQMAGGEIRKRIDNELRLVETELPRHFLPAPLPARVVHGDPKISNVLFDPKTCAASGLVDIDSTARHTALVDLGDAVRSWCRTGPEDEPTPFLVGRFRNVCAGYRDSGAMLSRREIDLIPQACRLITLELAARFLRDAMEDRYFGWDPARFGSRVEHNVARARGCLALFESMTAARVDMEEMAREILSKAQT